VQNPAHDQVPDLRAQFLHFAFLAAQQLSALRLLQDWQMANALARERE